MVIRHKLRLKPTAVKGLLAPDGFVVGLLGVSCTPKAHGRAWSSVKTVAVPGVGRTQTGISRYLDIPWWCLSKSWVSGGETCPGIAPSPFHLEPGLWMEDKQLCQNLLSGSETTQFSCLLKRCFSRHGPLGSKEKEMLWNMKVTEGNTLFIFPT